MTAARLVASVTFDLDNLWCYLKAYGDPDWERRPSYLDAVIPAMIDLFGSRGIASTVFVVGADAVRDDGARAVAAIAQAGHEVGNHSYEHEPWLHHYTREQLDDELAATERALQAAGAPRPRGFRAPGYSLPPLLIDVLAHRGYRYDASTLPTWIGPILRAYYFRGARLTPGQRATRGEMFGGLIDGCRPIRPFTWRGRYGGGPVLEIPVTTFPLLRIPIHASYILRLHQASPRLAKAYFRAAVRACQAVRLGPSILLHPTDLLDHRAAPGMEFFPTMAVPSAQKRALVGWMLDHLAARFDVVGTGEQTRRLVDL